MKKLALLSVLVLVASGLAGVASASGVFHNDGENVEIKVTDYTWIIWESPYMAPRDNFVVIEINPEDYEWTITESSDGSTWVMGYVIRTGLPPRTWTFVEVDFPITFPAPPFLAIAESLRYGESGHLEEPGKPETIPIYTTHFWYVAYTTDGGRLGFTYMAYG